MRKRESGQTLPLICLFMFSLIALCSLVIDLGGWLQARQHDQSTADAAALAGVQGIFNGQYGSLTQQYFTKNAKPGETLTYTLATYQAPNDSVLVTVNDQAPTYFAKLYGINSVHVQVQARATAQSVHAETGVALPLALYSACQPQAGTVIVLYGGNATCGSSPSNVGTIQVPAAGNVAGPCSGNKPSYTAVGNGASDIRDIFNGVLQTGEIDVGGCLANTKTGGSNNPGKALADGLNDQTMPFVALVPVVQQNAGSGQQGTYTVIAFEWVQITGCDGGTGNSSCSGGSSGKEIDGVVLGAYDGNSNGNVTPGTYIPGYLNFLGLTL